MDLWKQAIFVLDANLLLNLYRYSAKTRQEYMDLLRHPKIHERVWVPHQAALEYQENRLAVISQQRKACDDFKTQLDKVLKQLLNERSHPFISENLLGDLKTLNDRIVQELSDIAGALEQLQKFDGIREEITELLESRVGSPFSEEDIKTIHQEAELRTKFGRPPGFSDAKKDGPKRYGDFVIWRQILDKASAVKKPVIFITDDGKEDWWWHHEGRTIGPRPELRAEMYERAVQRFHMYSSSSFMQYANKFLHAKVSEEAIEEVKESRSGFFEAWRAAVLALPDDHYWHYSPENERRDLFALATLLVERLLEMEKTDAKIPDLVKALHLVQRITTRMQESQDDAGLKEEYSRLLDLLRSSKAFVDWQREPQRGVANP